MQPDDTPAILVKLAALLEYPESSEAGAPLEALCARLHAVCPQAADAVEAWQSYWNATPLAEVQELYTRTFDLNPVCPLDVGYYLFGEDYQRGFFMACLRESQEELGMTREVAQLTRELPDHLPLLLRWLARLYASEQYTEMAALVLVPVLRWMDDCLAVGDNPYRALVQAIARLLESDLTARGIAVADRGPGRVELGALRLEPA